MGWGTLYFLSNALVDRQRTYYVCYVYTRVYVCVCVCIEWPCVRDYRHIVRGRPQGVFGCKLHRTV